MLIVGRLDRYIHSRTSYTRHYEKAVISDKTSLEEFVLDPIAWVRMLVVAIFAPGTLFRSVKYGGGIGLPSVLFILLNTYYCMAMLHSGGSNLYYSLAGGFYISIVGYFFWVLMASWLHQLRKKMKVHPRFKHFLRFAVWNQFIMFWPISAAYLASFFFYTDDILIALLICLSLGYSIFGFIYVFKPRSLLAPMASLICIVSLFSTMSMVVGLRGVDGEHSEFSAWMDPKVAVPRLEYHYHNEKRDMIARYKRWSDPSEPEEDSGSFASNLE